MIQVVLNPAQGQTLERVKVDVGRTFAPGKLPTAQAGQADQIGQTYVAISRVTSLDGLELRNFRADK